MATTVKFGRLPRNAPSLTGTIVALAAEYRRVRDANIEDAWENGGEFEGHKVTDQRLLEYWEKRLKELSPDDPMWDVVNNRIHGYKFSIAESKHYLAYKRGNLSEAGMANFYREWANKMPQHSANWRDLMTKAAEFKAAAARGSAGSDSQARAEAYAKRQQHTYDTYEAGFKVFQDTVMNILHSQNIIPKRAIRSTEPTMLGGWGVFTKAGGENDPAALEGLLSWLDSDEPGAAEANAQITRTIQRYDPQFDGHFDSHSINRLYRRSDHGVQIAINRARKYGASETDINKIKTRGAIGSMAGVVLMVSDYEDQALKRQGRIEAIKDDMTLSPAAKAKAYDEEAQWFAPGGEGTKMLEGAFPKGALNPLSRNYNMDAASVMARHKGTEDMLRGNPSGLSIFDDPYGMSVEKAGKESIAAVVGNDVKLVNDAFTALLTGKEVLVRTDENGKITPNPTGYSTFRADDPRLLAQDMVPIPTSQQEAGGLTVFQQSKPLIAKAFRNMDPNTGEGIDEITNWSDSQNLGQVMSWRGADGQDITMYGVWSAGQLRWTPNLNSVLINGASVGVNGDGDYQVSGFPNPVQWQPSAQGASPVTRLNPNTPNPQLQAHSGVMIDHGALQNTSLAWDTPIQGAMFLGDTATSRSIAAMSDAQVRQNAFQYLKGHPTVAMNNAMRQGVKLEDAAAMDAEKTVASVQSLRFYGADPDARSRNMSAMAARARAEEVTRLANRNAMPQEIQARETLVADVLAWRDRFDSTPTSTVNIPEGSRPRAGSNPPLPVGMGEQNIANMINNPRITTREAAAIAAYLTKGAAGVAMPSGQTPTINGFPSGMVPTMPTAGTPSGYYQTSTPTTPAPATQTPARKPDEKKPDKVKEAKVDLKEIRQGAGINPDNLKNIYTPDGRGY